MGQCLVGLAFVDATGRVCHSLTLHNDRERCQTKPRFTTTTNISADIDAETVKSLCTAKPTARGFRAWQFKNSLSLLV